MYSVYAKKGNQTVCIYNDKYRAKDNIALSPKLDLVESAAGSFKIKLPQDNNGYSFIDRLTTEIIIYRNEVEIWSGRVISEDTDFWNNRTIECEGELAYLNDTIQPQAEYHNITPRNLLATLLNYHNQNAPADKRFTIGAVTVTDPNDSLYRYTNYESTLEAINEKLVKRLGGYLYIRKVNGTRYLDWLAEHPNTVSQPIRFGVNLLDFTKSFDSTDFCTVLLPLGERLEDDKRTLNIDALEEYLTVKSVNSGSPYVVNQNAYNNFGWIAKINHWDNVTDPSILKSKAQKYLTEVQFDTMELEVQAVDMHYTDAQIEEIGISDQIRVISEPHGLDRYFPVTKMSIPLDNPTDTAFTIGTSVKMGFTQRSNQANNSIAERIDSLPTESQILTTAKENADKIINSFTNGYITITKNDNGSNELYVSDVQFKNGEEIRTKANRYWRWNLNGLGYYDKNNTRGNPSYTGGGSSDGRNLRLAMTMDGHFIADYITAGTMYANRVRGGTLALGGSDQGDYKNGSLYIYNSGNQPIGSWTRNGIDIKSGSISIHNENNSKTFSVTTQGYLTSTGATITGEITATSGRIGRLDSAWNIGDKSIYNGCTGIDNTTGGTYVGIDGIRNQNGNSYVRIASGTLKCNNVDIDGGTLDIGANFSVNSNGVLTANSGSFTGAINTGSSITGATITGGSLTSDKGDGTKTEISGGLLKIWNNGSGEKYLTLYEGSSTLQIGGDTVAVTKGSTYASFYWADMFSWLINQGCPHRT